MVGDRTTSKETTMIRAVKATPFGSHLATKLEGANHKLVCALSANTTCTDDLYYIPPPITVPPGSAGDQA
jgi:hypothetical protein